MPFAAWFIASDYFQLTRMKSAWVVLAALAVTTLMFGVTSNYLHDGFVRSYAQGGTWDQLALQFEVDTRPAHIGAEDIWNGVSRFDQPDIAFVTEAAATDAGLYVNANSLGRLFIPWDSVRSLKRFRWDIEGGPRQMVTVILDDTRIGFDLSWDASVSEAAPNSIGVN